MEREDDAGADGALGRQRSSASHSPPQSVMETFQAEWRRGLGFWPWNGLWEEKPPGRLQGISQAWSPAILKGSGYGIQEGCSPLRLDKGAF